MNNNIVISDSDGMFWYVDVIWPEHRYGPFASEFEAHLDLVRFAKRGNVYDL